MKKHYLILPFILLLLSCSSQEGASFYHYKAAMKGPLLVTVDGVQIHEGLLDLFAEVNPRVKPHLANPLARKKIINSLVDQYLLYQEAMKKGLDKDTNVILKTMFDRHVIIANALINSRLQAAMKQAYDQKKDAEFTKVKVSIMAAYYQPNAKKVKKGEKPTEKQKKAALAKIKKMKSLLAKGESFKKVSKEYSDDKMTKKKGGVAGQVSQNDRRFARLGLT